MAVQTYKYQLTHSYLQLAAEMRSRKWLCCAEMPPVSIDLFVVVVFFLNLPHIIYIHTFLTLLCKISGSIASKSSPSSGGSYSWTLPGCSCPLNKVTLLTWKNKKHEGPLFCDPSSSSLLEDPFQGQPIFTFHHPPATLQEPSLHPLSNPPPYPTIGHSSRDPPSHLSRSSLQLVSPLSIIWFLNDLTLWDSRTNIQTYSMSTLPATSNVLNVVYSWDDHSFKSPEKSQWSVIRDRGNSPCFSAKKKKNVKLSILPFPQETLFSALHCRGRHLCMCSKARCVFLPAESWPGFGGTTGMILVLQRRGTVLIPVELLLLLDLQYGRVVVQDGQDDFVHVLS